MLYMFHSHLPQKPKQKETPRIKTQWPAGRCAFRMVRRPNGNILLASDGLSDPFDDLTLGELWEEKECACFWDEENSKRGR